MQELPHRVAGLEELVLKLEHDESLIDVYQQLFREVHSLKGSGGTHGFPVITTICHQIEDLLKDANDTEAGFGRDRTDAILNYVDLLSQASVRYQSGDSNLEEIKASLHSLQHSALDGHCRCLVVEGSATTLEIISLALADEKVEISHASNGLMALERLLQEKFDLLITSVAIGNLNGKALIAAMRLSDSANASTPAILLTSSETTKDVASLSANTVIRKGQDMPASLLVAFGELL